MKKIGCYNFHNCYRFWFTASIDAWQQQSFRHARFIVPVDLDDVDSLKKIGRFAKLLIKVKILFSHRNLCRNIDKSPIDKQCCLLMSSFNAMSNDCFPSGCANCSHFNSKCLRISSMQTKRNKPFSTCITQIFLHEIRFFIVCRKDFLIKLTRDNVSWANNWNHRRSLTMQ